MKTSTCSFNHANVFADRTGPQKILHELFLTWKFPELHYTVFNLYYCTYMYLHFDPTPYILFEPAYRSHIWPLFHTLLTYMYV